MAVDYVCSKCGSTNVTSDAVARWDVGRQRWVITGHYDSANCFDCDEETHLDEVEVAGKGARQHEARGL